MFPHDDFREGRGGQITHFLYLAQAKNILATCLVQAPEPSMTTTILIMVPVSILKGPQYLMDTRYNSPLKCMSIEEPHQTYIVSRPDSHHTHLESGCETKTYPSGWPWNLYYRCNDRFYGSLWIQLNVYFSVLYITELTLEHFICHAN